MAENVADNWLSLAKYDLATAEAMLRTERYLYVAFMCQQAVEKLLKACYVRYRAATPPYTHNLLRLAGELPWMPEIDASILAVLESLNSYYIESRYTEDIEELTTVLTQAKAGAILADTKEVFEWIISRL